MDRAFWVALRRMWPKWAEVLIIVKPETAVAPGRSRDVLALEIVPDQKAWYRTRDLGAVFPAVPELIG